MIQTQEYIQLKAFARQDGAFMGLLWIVSFACFVGSQKVPQLSFLFDMTIVAIPFFAFQLVKQYRDRVIGGIISFRRAYGFTILIFIYAMLILAIAQWAYFEFLDNGHMVQSMIAAVKDPQFKPVLDSYQLQLKDVTSQLEQLSETRPIDFAFTFMWCNFLVCTVLSWVIALFSKRSKVRI